MKSEVPPTDTDTSPAVRVEFTGGRFTALLGLLIAGCFASVVLGWETFYYADFGQFGYPVAFHHREAFWRGELPLWNALNSCGAPWLAQWNTMTLYPPALFYLLFPLSWSLGVLGLGHLLLAGTGMFFLARRWTNDPLAAAVAGTTFAFNGLTWYGLEWPNNLAAIGWMPWVVLAMERAGQEGGRKIVVAALAGALQMLTGAPEVIFQTWIFIGALALMEWYRATRPRWKLTGRILAAVGLIGGLTAVQLLPFLDLVAHSQRDPAYASSGVTAIAAMPWSGWLNYLVPAFHCARNPQGILLPADQPWVGSYYVGVGTLALAGVALARTRTPRAWLLAGLIALALLLALGRHGPLYGPLMWLFPPLGFMRYAVKFVVLANFALPLLAAVGVANLRAVPTNEWPRARRRLTSIALALAAAMAAIVALAWVQPANAGDLRATGVNALGRGAFLLLIVGCLLRLRSEVNPKSQRVLQFGLILLLWFDVFTHAPELCPTVSRSVFEPGTIRRFFHWDDTLRAGGSRARQSRASFWQMLSQSAADPEADTYRRRLSLFLNFNLLDDVPKIDGFYSLEIKEATEVFKQLYFGTNAAAPLQDFLGVSHVNHPTNTVDWIIRPSPLPLITAGQRPVFADPPETLAAMVQDSFAPLHTVYLPPEARATCQARAETPVKLGPPAFTTHRIEVAVDADAAATVVVAQTFYHPWRAYVDERPTPLWRANYAFQALEVPPGKHLIRLVYEDRAFALGARVSWVSAFVGAAAWIGWRKRSARQGSARDS